jgi:D-lactate dehydrogenase
MKIIFYNAKPYDEEFFTLANSAYKHSLTFNKDALSSNTMHFSKDYDCVCVSVRDTVDRKLIQQLKKYGIKLLALRSAGYDHVDIVAAKELGIPVVYAPVYSPYAIAEHTIMLMLALNRKIKDSLGRVQNYNFSLDGLIGFDMYKKTVGIIGTGKIGLITAKILQGFGCNVIAYDIFENPECKMLGIPYVSFDNLIESSDIISLHCPLTPETKYLIDTKTISKMKKGVMLINTARGELIDTNAAIKGLKSAKIGLLGLDVYEKEKGIFFEDKSKEGIVDDNLKTLLTFPNVIITAHQASFTKEAKENIANIILQSVSKLDNKDHKDNFYKSYLL